MNRAEYQKFIDTGEVSGQIIKSISRKIKEGEKLSMDEKTVFSSKSSEIEDLLSSNNNSFVVSEEIYHIYINTGRVSQEVLIAMAKKIKYGHTLTTEEVVIYSGKSMEIEKLLK